MSQHQSIIQSITVPFPAEFQPMTILFWLTAITSPAPLLLVSLHTGTQLNVHPRWRGKAETLGHLDQIEFVHIKDGTETVRGVSLQIRPVAILCGLCLCC